VTLGDAHRRATVLEQHLARALDEEIEVVTHLGLANWVQEIITGVIIIVAVALDRLRHRRGARG
jgi:predicted ABC-type sugar transport system permease subunit